MIPEPHASLQHRLLATEGVEFEGAKIDMKRFGWSPAKIEGDSRQTQEAENRPDSRAENERCGIELFHRTRRGIQGVSEPVIQVENLYKSYGAVQALRGVSFAVEQGEVFGLLGPNGAGKTTTIEILEGMRTPDAGRARVCGLDPERSGEKFKETIGAVLQSTSLPDKIRVKEAIDLFANFYRERANTDDLLKRFQLDEKRNGVLQPAFRWPETAARAGDGAGE